MIIPTDMLAWKTDTSLIPTPSSRDRGNSWLLRREKVCPRDEPPDRLCGQPWKHTPTSNTTWSQQVVFIYLCVCIYGTIIIKEKEANNLSLFLSPSQFAITPLTQIVYLQNTPWSHKDNNHLGRLFLLSQGFSLTIIFHTYDHNFIC